MFGQIIPLSSTLMNHRLILEFAEFNSKIASNFIMFYASLIPPFLNADFPCFLFIFCDLFIITGLLFFVLVFPQYIFGNFSILDQVFSRPPNFKEKQQDHILSRLSHADALTPSIFLRNYSVDFEYQPITENYLRHQNNKVY